MRDQEDYNVTLTITNTTTIEYRTIGEYAHAYKSMHTIIVYYTTLSLLIRYITEKIN